MLCHLYQEDNGHFSSQKELAKIYPHFAQSLRDYLASLDDDYFWRMENCWNINLDGSAFTVVCRSMRDHEFLLNIAAQLQDAQYVFTASTTTRALL